MESNHDKPVDKKCLFSPQMPLCDSNLWYFAGMAPYIKTGSVLSNILVHHCTTAGVMS